MNLESKESLLTEISLVKTRGKTNLYLFKCKCGGETITTRSKVKSFYTRSCGCLKTKFSNSDLLIKKVKRSYINHAKERNLQFELEHFEFENLILSNCYYCNTGLTNSLNIKNEKLFYNGIDRINNNDGYNKLNCVTACFDCNAAKRSHSYDNFLLYIKNIYNYSILKLDQKPKNKIDDWLYLLDSNFKFEKEERNLLTPIKHIETINKDYFQPSSERKHNLKNEKWLFKCECGNEVIVDKYQHKINRVKSCGCLRTRNIKSCNVPDGLTAFNNLYNHGYKSKSKKERNIIFSLSRNDFLFLTKQNCSYCGKEPSSCIKSDKSFYIYNGIDRVDNNKGYVIENCITSCGICNLFKAEMSQEKFYQWIINIVNNLNLKDIH